MINFNEGQINRLKKLGLSEFQLQALERDALLKSKLFLDKKPSLNDIRHDLDSIQTPLKEIQKSLNRILQYPQSRPEKEYVLNFLEAEAGYGFIDNALSQTTELHRIVEKVRSELTKNQTRGNLGSPYPIKLIHEALITDGSVSIPVSSSPKSAFREVASIFYETILGKEYDPEHPIKAYTTHLKKDL